MKQLLLSIHDVTPAHRERIARLEALIARATGGSSTYAMLVVPDFHGRAPIAGDRAFHGWLRARAEAGVEILLHGWFHRDQAKHSGAAAWKAKHMTAGEGEFLGLSLADATRRLRDGRALLEDILGRAVTGFVAPAWLYGDGARAALADEGFGQAEDHMRVWSPASGAVLARGPVVSYASRSGGRILSSLAWSRVATTALARLTTARVALHPHDVDVPALGRELRRAVQAFLVDRRLGRYDALGTAAGA